MMFSRDPKGSALLDKAMKLLMLIHRLPCPADRGAILRADLELRWLASRHDVWCAGLWDSGDARTDAGRNAMTELRSVCRGVIAVPLHRISAGLRAMGSLFIGGTATDGYFRSAALEWQVMQLSREAGFDAVLAFSSSMAPLALRVPARRRVLDMVDLDSWKWAESVQQAKWPKSQVYRMEARRLARREREWMAAFDATVLVNQREAELVAEGLRERVHVVETGVPGWHGSVLRPVRFDTGLSTDPCHPTQRAALPEEPVVGFVGAMDYAPNVDAACWFAESIWPRVRASRPDANWLVVGRSPARAVRKLDDGRSVHVTGTVPAVEPYLERMRVSVAPLRLARGVQNKVLAAMAAGRPCVVTSCVAEGIGARADEELVVADAPDRFADAVINLLSNRPRAEAIGRAGQEFVSRRHRPAQGLEEIEALLCGSSDEKEPQASACAAPRGLKPAALLGGV